MCLKISEPLLLFTGWGNWAPELCTLHKRDHVMWCKPSVWCANERATQHKMAAIWNPQVRWFAVSISLNFSPVIILLKVPPHRSMKLYKFQPGLSVLAADEMLAFVGLNLYFSLGSLHRMLIRNIFGDSLRCTSPVILSQMKSQYWEMNISCFNPEFEFLSVTDSRVLPVSV